MKPSISPLETLSTKQHPWGGSEKFGACKASSTRRRRIAPEGPLPGMHVLCGRSRVNAPRTGVELAPVVGRIWGAFRPCSCLGKAYRAGSNVAKTRRSRFCFTVSKFIGAGVTVQMWHMFSRIFFIKDCMYPYIHATGRATMSLSPSSSNIKH